MSGALLAWRQIPGKSRGRDRRRRARHARRRRRRAEAVPRRSAARPCCARTLGLFADIRVFGLVQPVIHPDDGALYAQAADGLDAAAAGRMAARRGRLRCRPGLRRWRRMRPDIVLVHDAARPFASRALDRARDRRGAANRRGDPGAAGDRHGQARRRGTASSARRSTARRLRAVQTPQAFAFDALLEAHRRAARERPRRLHRRRGDRRMGRHAGHRVRRRERQYQDHHPEDFMRAEAMTMRQLGDVRTGTGYRRACLRPRRSCHARRHPHSA